MSELDVYRTAPIVTGKPGITQAGKPAVRQQNTKSFGSVFQQVLQDTARTDRVLFSKHAAARMEERSIRLDAAGMARLNKGVQMARSKGLHDALILVDHNAFVVSAPNRTVITAVGGRELSGNVFTNIDGTVVI